MKNSISKPVQLLIAAGFLLVIAVLWFGHNQCKKKEELATSSVVAGQTATNPVPTNITAPETETTDGLPPVIPISLTNVLDAAEKDLAKTDTSVQSLPQGTQVYGGVEFWLQGMIHLQGLATRDQENRNFRTKIIVPLDQTNFVDGETSVTHRGSNIATIYLLGGARYSSRKDGETFADVILNYGDGSTSRNEVKYNVHLRDWYRLPYEDPVQLPNAFTRVAWKGPYPIPKDHSLRLYRIAFANPHPEKVIRSIEFASTMARPALFVSALTLDPLAFGTRVDDLTSQELADPELNGQLQLFVQDTEGHPLADAQVSYSFKSASDSSSGQQHTTDNTGMALVRFPDSGLETLDVSAEHGDYSGRKMLWDLQAGDTVPETYTLKLTAGVNIGAVVVDESNAPIAGANITLNRFWAGGEEMNKKGLQSNFTSKSATSDAQGQWQVNGLPADLLDHIMFDVKHPDFVGTNYTVGLGEVESQLRAGTMKIILHHGWRVQGTVTDDSDNPIGDATVFAGQRYYRERQQMHTSADGRFYFNRMSEGEMEFSVLAKDRSPLVKTITVKPGMPDVIFKLGAGKVIRAIVQNVAGEPLPGTRVSLESANGGVAESYEFDTTTDSDGRFVWDGAPDEPVHFYFYKSGYEQKRRQELKPDVDNVVTLQKARTIQGYVLETDTEKPVSKFRIGVGRFPSGGVPFFADYPGMKGYADSNGMFTLTLNEEQDDGVKAEADDYAGTVVKLPAAQDDVVQVTIHLKPSASLRGVVEAPDGTPLEGVSVTLVTGSQGYGASLAGTHLRSWGSGSQIVITDAQGKFTLGPPPDSGGTIVAVGDLGYASASADQLQANPTLVLQPFGRIEGTLKIAGQPGVGKDLLFTPTIPGMSTDSTSYKSTTDDQGQFTMEKIPPGEGAIVRLITTSPNSSTYSDSTPVTVKPGETAKVTLGDDGATLVGRIRFENPPTNDVALSYQGFLSGQMPQMPVFHSSTEAQAYFKTPEYQALMRQRKNYAIEMNPDGSFTVEDVVPGIYSLNISARVNSGNPWTHPPVANGSTPVTVPDSFSPTTPVDIGEIVLVPTPATPPVVAPPRQ